MKTSVVTSVVAFVSFIAYNETEETMMLAMTRPQVTSLSEDEAHLAEAGRQLLLQAIHHAESAMSSSQSVLHMSVDVQDGSRAEIAVPRAAISPILSVLRELGHGKGVFVVATDREITTQQAADFMHVSRPYFVKLLDRGAIPYRKVGVRRRVRLEDVLHYMQETGDAAASALDDMAAENQRLGLYP
jgi:excisionase family DNA binding protein